MQTRHLNRQQYFNELAQTSEKHLIPYISQYHNILSPHKVLEIGCGDGGNLLPFAKIGCKVIGIDINSERILDSKTFFQQQGISNAEFFTADITQSEIGFTNEIDIILCHDVIEHIYDKQELITKIAALLNRKGIAFIAFPAWHMPFGGHQQICKNKLLSNLPWIHLLPTRFYTWLLRVFGENDSCIDELVSIKKCRISIEKFEELIHSSKLKIIHRKLWLINPHYETKFHLHPKELPTIFAHIPIFCNFFATSCFYILQHGE